MSLFDKRLQGTGALEIMILLENLLHRTYVSNKEYSDSSYHCYSYFLIHYMGKNYTAYKLLQDRMDGRPGVGKDKKKKPCSIEELAILDDITLLNYNNLKSGNLALSYFPQLTNECVTDTRKLNIYEHMNFLNRFEDMKKEVN